METPSQKEKTAQERIKRQQIQKSKIKKAEGILAEPTENLSVGQLETRKFKLQNALWETIPADLASEINDEIDALTGLIEEGGKGVSLPTTQETAKQSSLKQEENPISPVPGTHQRESEQKLLPREKLARKKPLHELPSSGQIIITPAPEDSTSNENPIAPAEARTGQENPPISISEPTATAPSEPTPLSVPHSTKGARFISGMGALGRITGRGIAKSKAIIGKINNRAVLGVKATTTVAQQAGKNVAEGIHMMGEGHARATNPERNTKLEQNETTRKTTDGSAEKNTPNNLDNGILAARRNFDRSFSNLRTPSDISIKGPENSATPAEVIVQKEIKQITPTERTKVEKGIHNIGFRVERAKNDWFAKTFDWLSKKGDQKGAVSRFTRSLRDSYKKEGDSAQHKAQAGKDAGKLTKLSNIAYLAKNFLRPLRILADATGLSPTSLTRYMMIGGTIAARLTGAMKEARLANEELLEKNRIDIDKATEEAWKVYENAQKKAGTTGNVSADDLRTGYLQEIPRDLQERLRSPAFANQTTKNLFQKHLEFDVNRLNTDIQKIENDPKLSAGKKETLKDQLLRRWEKRLLDYDRIITITGTVDTWAMVGRYAESTSKNIVRAVTLETLYLSVDKLFEMWAGVGISTELHQVFDSVKHQFDTPHIAQKIADAGVKDAVARISPISTGPTSTNARDMIGKLFHQENTPRVAQEIIPPSPVTTIPIEISHRVGTEFSFTLGQNGVPKDLETVFNSIAADHMQVPADGNINEEFATKSLNMAANMVKLTEGHNVAGVTQAEWEKAGNFWDGKLEIKDHKAFNNIVEKLQAHANENWTNGKLQSEGAAITYVPRISHDSWLRVIHAEGLDKTPEGISTGIVGHDEVTSEKITDFNHSDLIEKARLKVEASMDHFAGKNIDPTNDITPDYEKEFAEKALTGNVETAEAFTVTEKLDPLKDVLESPISQPETASETVFTNDTHTIITSNLSEQIFRQTNDLYMQNMRAIFPDFTEDVEKMVSEYPANQILTLDASTAQTQGISDFIRYVHKLEEVTKIKPKGKIWGIRDAETIAQFIRRALQKAGEDGTLDKVIIK